VVKSKIAGLNCFVVEIVVVSSKIKGMKVKPFHLLFVLSLAFNCLWFSCAGEPPVEIPQIPEEIPRPEAEPEEPEEAAVPVEEPAAEVEPEPVEEPEVVTEAEEPAEPEPVAEPEEPERTGDFLFPLEPVDLVFIPADPPALVYAPGVGTIIRETRVPGAPLTSEARVMLQNSFRAAYVDGLLRGLPLAGVLGGDQVHGWPDTNPLGWVQNWRSARPVFNSWGIPSLILAVQGVEASRQRTQSRVFIVDGEILNYYGISAGLNGANGNLGYGSPRGEKFFYNNNSNNSIAQRFDFGLIVIDQEGTGSFLPEEPPSGGLEPPPELGLFPELPLNENIRDAFLTAWKMAQDRNVEAMVPDGPGQYLSGFSGDPVFSDAGELGGLYVQTFNGRSALLILPEAPGVPLHARFLGSPFLDAFITREGEDFVRQLMGGISVYGFPLTDPMPLQGR
jgi:hypothetical protein